MIFYMTDKYIQGKVAFEDLGNYARMSFTGRPRLPNNAQYEIEGKTWKVVTQKVSDFNPTTVNLELELVNG